MPPPAVRARFGIGRSGTFSAAFQLAAAGRSATCAAGRSRLCGLAALLSASPRTTPETLVEHREHNFQIPNYPHSVSGYELYRYKSRTLVGFQTGPQDGQDVWGRSGASAEEPRALALRVSSGMMIYSINLFNGGAADSTSTTPASSSPSLSLRPASQSIAPKAIKRCRGAGEPTLRIRGSERRQTGSATSPNITARRLAMRVVTY